MNDATADPLRARLSLCALLSGTAIGIWSAELALLQPAVWGHGSGAWMRVFLGLLLAWAVVPALVPLRAQRRSRSATLLAGIATLAWSAQAIGLLDARVFLGQGSATGVGATASRGLAMLVHLVPVLALGSLARMRVGPRPSPALRCAHWASHAAGLVMGMGAVLWLPLSLADSEFTAVCSVVAVVLFVVHLRAGSAVLHSADEVVPSGAGTPKPVMNGLFTVFALASLPIWIQYLGSIPAAGTWGPAGIAWTLAVGASLGLGWLWQRHRGGELPVRMWRRSMLLSCISVAVGLGLLAFAQGPFARGLPAWGSFWWWGMQALFACAAAWTAFALGAISLVARPGSRRLLSPAAASFAVLLVLLVLMPAIGIPWSAAVLLACGAAACGLALDRPVARAGVALASIALLALAWSALDASPRWQASRRHAGSVVVSSHGGFGWSVSRVRNLTTGRTELFIGGDRCPLAGPSARLAAAFGAATGEDPAKALVIGLDAERVAKRLEAYGSVDRAQSLGWSSAAPDSAWDVPLALSRSTDRFGLICVAPAALDTAWGAVLYGRQFLRLAADRLQPKGVFVIPIDFDGATVMQIRIAMQEFSAAFPTALFHMVDDVGLLIAGADSECPATWKRVAARMQDPPLAEDLKAGLIGRVQDLFGSRIDCVDSNRFGFPLMSVAETTERWPFTTTLGYPGMGIKGWALSLTGAGRRLIDNMIDNMHRGFIWQGLDVVAEGDREAWSPSEFSELDPDEAEAWIQAREHRGRLIKARGESTGWTEFSSTGPAKAAVEQLRAVLEADREHPEARRLLARLAYDEDLAQAQERLRTGRPWDALAALAPWQGFADERADSVELRAMAWLAVGAARPAARALLHWRLERPRGQAIAAAICSRLGEGDAARALRQALEAAHPDEAEAVTREVESYLVATTEQNGGRAAWSRTLRRMAKGLSVDILSSAAQTLEARAALRVSDQDPLVPLLAEPFLAYLGWMGKIGPPPTGSPFARRPEEGHPVLDDATWQRLASGHEPGLAIPSRDHALRSIALLGARQAREPLFAELTRAETSAEHEQTLRRVLACIVVDEPEAVARLLPFIAKDAVARRLLASWAPQRGGKSAAPWLFELLDDADPKVRLSADVALRRISGRVVTFDYAAPRALREIGRATWREELQDAGLLAR